MFFAALKYCFLAAASGCVCVMLCGCGAGPLASPAVTSVHALSGVVHGGQQPIANAVVSLYAAGNSGYGSATPALASTTTDSNGKFSFQPSGVASYSCPASNSATQSSLVYLVVSGGQALGSGNPSNNYIGLMAVLGDCTNAMNQNASVTINEVTTIAGMAALQQFFSPNAAGLGSFGALAGNVTELLTAAQTAYALASDTTGQSQVATVTGLRNDVITVTPEIANVNTEANVLAACINSDPGSSSACQTLMADVNGTAAVDTLQAAYYMASNPTSTVTGTSNVGTLFGLTNARTPFQPALSAAPTDWSLAVTYGSNSVDTAEGGSYVLSGARQLALDSSGAMWVMNYAGAAANSGNGITELEQSGVVKDIELPTIAGPSAILEDKFSNVWVAVPSAATVWGYDNSAVQGNLSVSFDIGAPPIGLSTDEAGDIFILASAQGSGELYELEPYTKPTATKVLIASGLASGQYAAMALDSRETIWITGGGPVATDNGVYQFVRTESDVTPYLSTATNVTTAGNVTTPGPIAADANDHVWVANIGDRTLSELSGKATVTGNSFATPGLGLPTAMATDSGGNVWVTNQGRGGSVFGYSSTGAALTPAAGFVHTFAMPDGIAIDYAGNIWVANEGAMASSSSQGYVTVIVGQAAPAFSSVFPK